MYTTHVYPTRREIHYSDSRTYISRGRFITEMLVDRFYEIHAISCYQTL